jgi:hypothetical protein
LSGASTSTRLQIGQSMRIGPTTLAPLAAKLSI